MKHLFIGSIANCDVIEGVLISGASSLTLIALLCDTAFGLLVVMGDLHPPA